MQTGEEEEGVYKVYHEDCGTVKKWITGCKICGGGAVFQDCNRDVMNFPSHLNFTQEKVHWGVKALLEAGGVNRVLTRLQPPSGEITVTWPQCCINHSLINCESMRVTDADRQTLAGLKTFHLNQTESTALGSWSCAIQTSSWGRGRRTSGGRTPACGWFSEFTSTRPRGEPWTCRRRPTPSSAVSTSPRICFSSLTSSVTSCLWNRILSVAVFQHTVRILKYHLESPEGTRTQWNKKENKKIDIEGGVSADTHHQRVRSDDVSQCFIGECMVTLVDFLTTNMLVRTRGRQWAC